MIAWVNTPEGEGALVGFCADQYGDCIAVVVIDKRFRSFRMAEIEWLRWPE